mgnify:CR=1 FL=1
MADLSGILAIALAFFVVAVSPGPANIAVATIAMRFGRAAGLVFGAGLAAGARAGVGAGGGGVAAASSGGAAGIKVFCLSGGGRRIPSDH